MPERVIAAEIQPVPDRASQAALALQRLGFRILHIGLTISVEGAPSLWASTFNVTFEQRRKRVLEELEGGEVTYQQAVTEHMRISPHLQDLVRDVAFVEPPEFY